MPLSVFGGVILTNTARNCLPCSRSVIQLPEAEAYSPGVTLGAWPTSVIRSRSPRTFSRSTQKPLSALWNVTRSTRAEEPFGPRRLNFEPPCRLNFEPGAEANL